MLDLYLNLYLLNHNDPICFSGQTTTVLPTLEIPQEPPMLLLNVWSSFDSNSPLNRYSVIYITVDVLLLVSWWSINSEKGHFSTQTSETRQKLVAMKAPPPFLLHYIATCLLISSCGCRSAFSLLLTMPHVPSELPWGLFISSFVCLFVCAFTLLCSWANKAPFCPGCWCSPIKACDQPERFNDGCDAGVDRLT